MSRLSMRTIFWSLKLLAGGIFLSAIIIAFFAFDIKLTLGQDQPESAEVKKISDQIKAKKDRADELSRRQEEYAKALEQKQSEKLDLTNQMGILDNRVASLELDIMRTGLEIDQVTLEIKKLSLEISDKEDKLVQEKEHIATILRALHQQDRVNTLQVLLLNDSLSDFLNQVKYLEDVNSELGDSVRELEKLRDELLLQKANQEKKNTDLAILKKDLDDKKTALLAEKESKQFLIVQTESSEIEFQRLIRLAKQEQAQAASDVVSLEKAMREKLEQQKNKKLVLNPNGLIWPVTKNTVTAYFHDPDYPFRYVFEHPAIDIRAKQGTVIRAAASGYVARAKDAGQGYSYIMIVHGDGLSTVYGHVSKIMVDEEQYVVQGQQIGLSGGTPGTPGAGNMTSGPHLHFEVRLNGIPVNPLEYLK